MELISSAVSIRFYNTDAVCTVHDMDVYGDGVNLVLRSTYVEHDFVMYQIIINVDGRDNAVALPIIMGRNPVVRPYAPESMQKDYSALKMQECNHDSSPYRKEIQTEIRVDRCDGFPSRQSKCGIKLRARRYTA